MKRWVPKHKTHFYVVSGVESLLAADIVSLVVARVVVSCVCVKGGIYEIAHIITAQSGPVIL